MLNMSFSRYKGLLKLSRNVVSSIDFGQRIDLRYYSVKVIYTSESPHEVKVNRSSVEQEQPYKEEQFYQKRPNRKNNYNKSDGSYKYKNKYKKNYGRKSDSDEYKNKFKHDVTEDEPVEKKKFTQVELFDPKYAFLDDSEEIRIKPKSPIEEDNLKPEKVYRRNYRIQDNPSYVNVLSFEDNNEETAGIESNDINLNSLAPKQRKIYSFDSNLVFEENTDDNPQLKLDIANELSNSIENNTTECIVDVTTDSNLKKTNLKPRYKTIDTPEGQITLNLANDEFDLKDFIKEYNEKIPGPLDECTDDISYFGSSLSPTFNFAAYADKSKLIQQYIKLGVKLYKVEKNMDHMRALLTVDMEKELPLYIQFLHDCGIPADCLGDAITENPMILKEDIDDMKTRIRYLRAHKFTPGSIARILTKNPSWLVWATKYIDERLGHFQNEFKLNGSEIRFLATKQPKLITYKMKHVNENTFAMKEQMGFNGSETKLLLLYKPRLWMNNRKKIVDSFDYLHNTMKLSHLTIASQADVLTTRKCRIKNRHEFLVELKKAQYDPKKPGYIAPKSIVLGSDADFCNNIAKTAVDTFNLFLRTR